VSPTTVFGVCGAVAVGLGLYGMIVSPQPLRRILAFDLLGSGVFLLLGVVARRGAAAGFGGDPVGQALTITGVVVAFAATALTAALWCGCSGDRVRHVARRRPCGPSAGA
jgi:multicomponent Na+:H+ antiporter subunit C